MKIYPAALPLILITLFPGAAAIQAQERELDIPRASIPIPGIRPSHVWTEPFQPMTNKEKVRVELLSAFGPVSMGTALASAALDHRQTDPEEWGQGWGPFGQRFGSRMGTRLIRRGIRHGLSVIRDEDPRFFRSGAQGFWPRFQNQLKQTAVVRTDSGGTTFAAGRIVGAMAAAQISQVWTPPSRDGVGVNMARGGMVLLTDLGVRTLREFWPEIRRKIGRN